MGWFRRRRTTPGSFRVTSVVPMPTRGRLILNDVPQQLSQVAGIMTVEGAAPRAFSLQLRSGPDDVPAVGDVLAADVEPGEPMRATVHWGTTRERAAVAALQGAGQAEVLAELMRSGTATHTPGEADALGIAVTDPAAADTLATQLAAAMDTPISLDVDVDGVRRTVRAGGGGHLSSADAARLLRIGIPATATIAAATRVALPAAMLPGPEASLWDLELDVRRADGSAYRARNRTAYRTEARRAVLGAVGRTIPVRIDPDDDARVAVDGDTFDAENPGAPPR
jgi:hypothetical protein